MLNKQKKKQVALDRINELFSQASLAFKKDKKRANRYVQLARKISMRSKVRIPSNLKRRYCKHCHNYLLPGVNCRIRTKNKKVVYYCLDCKKYMKFMLK